MRGDTLTAGIGRFDQHLYEYRMRGDLFPGALRKGTLGKNSVRGNKFSGLGVLERDTSFERDLKGISVHGDLTVENFRFHRQSEVDNQEAGPAVSGSDIPCLPLNGNQARAL